MNGFVIFWMALASPWVGKSLVEYMGDNTASRGLTAEGRNFVDDFGGCKVRIHLNEKQVIQRIEPLQKEDCASSLARGPKPSLASYPRTNMIARLREFEDSQVVQVIQANPPFDCSRYFDKNLLEKLASYKKKISAQYQSCETANDCHYIRDVGGSLVRKDKAVMVSHCLNLLSQAVRGNCPYPSFKFEKNENILREDIYPRLKCIKNLCRPEMKYPGTDWEKSLEDYLAKNPGQRVAAEPDALCQTFINEAKQSR